LHSPEKRSYRAESIEGITSTREGVGRCKSREKRQAKERQTAKNKDGTENARWTAARGKQRRGMDVEKRREKEKKKRRTEGGDGERFHEESGWLTDDLIKRGTNYRPAGC